jgi:hypothetical protein
MGGGKKPIYGSKDRHFYLKTLKKKTIIKEV